MAGEAGEVVAVAARAAELLRAGPAALADQQLLAAVEAVEELARHVEALQLTVAHEVEVRSAGGPEGEEGLARKLGHRGAAQALEMLTRSSAKEAGRRVRLSRRLRGFPAVQAALEAGRPGAEHAEAITGPLGGAARVAAPADLALAEAALVESAATLSADLVAAQAKLWAARLDQDGIEPSFEDTLAKRFFTIGNVAGGLAKVSGLLPAPHAAAVQAVLDAYVNPRSGVRFHPDGHGERTGTAAGASASGAEGGSADPGGRPAPGGGDFPPRDTRTAGQKRADALRDVFAAQARADQTPELGGDHPTVWVRTTETELAAGPAWHSSTAAPNPSRSPLPRRRPAPAESRKSSSPTTARSCAWAAPAAPSPTGNAAP